MSIELTIPSNHLILCSLLLILPSIFPSIRVFSNESVLHIRWPKYCSFSFSISLSNEYSELISFRIDWFDLLAVQGTLKSLLLHYSSNESILWLSTFLMVQLSHLYITTGKTIGLTIPTFAGKVMSPLFNTLSRFLNFIPQLNGNCSWYKTFFRQIGRKKRIKSLEFHWKWKSLSPVWLFATPWNSPGQNTGVGRLSLLQGIFPNHGWNRGLPHCRRIFFFFFFSGGFFTSWATSEAKEYWSG